MEIILKKDTPSLGKLGNVVKVADGYARNYLIPHGVGIEATPKNLKLLEREIKLWQKKAEKQREEAQKLAQEIEQLSLSFARKVGEEDKIFGSVTSLDIEEKIKESGIQIDRKKIHLEEPIKALGIFTVPVKLHTEVTANLKVCVVKE
jgi:large subunit ribosomal protein L9